MSFNVGLMPAKIADNSPGIIVTMTPLRPETSVMGLVVGAQGTNSDLTTNSRQSSVAQYGTKSASGLTTIMSLCYIT